ncbi:MAG: glycoside hydrolase family 2, partial [Gemmatimonadetes bacterium]|nr:glycoside hydrolase family 2 [Gemmatimonadota bacterium]
MISPLSRVSGRLLGAAAFLFASASPLTAQTGARELHTLHDGWRFTAGSISGAEQPGLDDSRWQQVTVPHDWAISGPVVKDGDADTGKLPWRGEGWYRRPLEVPASYAGKRVYLLFDGVMAFPTVYVNGTRVGGWDYGYNSFYIDVTEQLRPGGANLLAVHADTRPHRSRWYPGAGIYRKVQLLAVDPVHVEVWGTHVTTPVVKPNYADVRIMTTVRNQATSAADVTVQQIILSPEGRELARADAKGSIAAGGSRDLEVTVPLGNPRRWDIDSPVRYTARTTVLVGGVVRDVSDTRFGVRTMRFTADHGFWLNDRRVQLQGVNLHHDHGPLGAAFYPRAMERQLEIMKSLGANAIRTSHNVPAPEVLELADSMGLRALDELFDKWDGTADFVGDGDFDEFALRNVRNFVRRDRNHPALYLWSVGNEVGDAQWTVNNG